MKQVVEEFGIHRATVYRWIRRARSLNQGYLRHTGLCRQSRAPHRKRADGLLPEERVAIEALRIRYGWCAQRVTGYLKQTGGLRQAISCSSVYRFLKKKGMIQAQGYHRRPVYQSTLHMHLKNTTTVGKLQMDVKYVTPELSGLPHTTFEYALIDIFSRYKQAVILPVLDMQYAVRALDLLLAQLPFRADFLQTDNGLEFQSRFVQYCKGKGLQHHFIHKRTPNENAVIERSFRTDEEEFYYRLPGPAKDLLELNQWYQKYLVTYNTIRPHLGLNLLTPAQVVANVLNQ